MDISKCLAEVSSLTRPKHFEQDTTWLRIGLAVRTAIDVNLHRIALDPQAVKAMPKWSLRNVLRTWLSCYIVDRAVSSQLGKPPSVRGENAIRLYMNLITRDDIRETIEDVWVAALAVSAADFDSGQTDIDVF